MKGRSLEWMRAACNNCINAAGKKRADKRKALHGGYGNLDQFTGALYSARKVVSSEAKGKSMAWKADSVDSGAAYRENNSIMQEGRSDRRKPPSLSRWLQIVGASKVFLLLLKDYGNMVNFCKSNDNHPRKEAMKIVVENHMEMGEFVLRLDVIILIRNCFSKASLGPLQAFSQWKCSRPGMTYSSNHHAL
eukprot:c23015_g1_i2 orf=394-966(+)